MLIALRTLKDRLNNNNAQLFSQEITLVSIIRKNELGGANVFWYRNVWIYDIDCEGTIKFRGLFKNLVLQIINVLKIFEIRISLIEFWRSFRLILRIFM